MEGVVRGVIVAVPVAVGVYAYRRPTHARFGALLLAFSGIWFVAALSTSASPVVYSFGRIAGWIAEAALAYVVLAFPTGRLENDVDRIVIAIAIAITIGLYLPTALVVSHYPAPFPAGSCDADCPSNAFMLLRHQPAWIDGFLSPLRGILTTLVFLIVAIRLTQRLRDANTLVRHTVAPVLAASSARMLLLACVVVARAVAPYSAITRAGAWTLALLVPVIALSFLAGLVRWRVFVTSAIQSIHAQLRDVPGPGRVQDVLASAFEDPDLQIGRWVRRRRRWIGVDGRPLDAPDPGSGRYLTEARDGSQRVVAILHDTALRDEPAFIDVATSIAAMAFASDRLTARTAGMLRELRASRARIAAAADSERRRIERDLHDGAQQRLVALRIQLELAADEAQHQNPAEAASLRELGVDADRALEDIRALAHGIYPAILSHRGLAEAVRSAALRAPIATSVEADGLGDYPDEISTTVYLCCVEALQNIAKHARGATAAEIVLRETGPVLRFSISDDGVGFRAAQARVGAGIINMRDRLATVGGELIVRSRPGHGTCVIGRIPLSVTATKPAGINHGEPTRLASASPRPSAAPRPGATARRFARDNDHER
jgi:signal transduction histidine kinase